MPMPQVTILYLWRTSLSNLVQSRNTNLLHHGFGRSERCAWKQHAGDNIQPQEHKAVTANKPHNLCQVEVLQRPWDGTQLTACMAQGSMHTVQVKLLNRSPPQGFAGGITLEFIIASVLLGT